MTDTSKHTLTPVQQKFILHWGEMGTRWGINRTVAQIHALLFLSPAPLHAEDIAATLGVARSNVSTSLRELQGWGIVRVTHILGDRRDHFESMKDVWEMFRIIVDERKKREADPTLAMLREAVAEAKKPGAADAYTRERLADMLAVLRVDDQLGRADAQAADAGGDPHGEDGRQGREAAAPGLTRAKNLAEQFLWLQRFRHDGRLSVHPSTSGALCRPDPGLRQLSSPRSGWCTASTTSCSAAPRATWRSCSRCRGSDGHRGRRGAHAGRRRRSRPSRCGCSRAGAPRLCAAAQTVLPCCR